VLLAVDVGNTQTHVGAFEGERLAHDWRLTTEPSATADELVASLATLLRLSGLDFGALDGAIVSTVVPQLAPEYARLCERHVDGAFLAVGPSLKTGMPIRVENPHELGADRIVNAVASFERVGGACVSVDFGTSTNFDVVSAGGEYLGGVIGPGVEISIGAIQSGFAHGFAGLVDGINRRIAEELEARPTFIATGGLAETIAPLCETIDEVDPLLTLRGLRLIFDMNA